MDKQIQINRPDYKRIYFEMISRKFPEKMEKCTFLLSKEYFSPIDVITMQRIIFGNQKNEYKDPSQKHRSYDKETILQMLRYQKKERLNNTQLASHFKLSRNSIAKWKQMFNNEI